mmetsp:Transcript_22091/g.28581  ORF Transcript_22091/g.28581 Transcript_22091/m.28581 type:complete len:320 (-) Transcript_22091:45-1004(-)
MFVSTKLLFLSNKTNTNNNNKDPKEESTIMMMSANSSPNKMALILLLLAVVTTSTVVEAFTNTLSTTTSTSAVQHSRIIFGIPQQQPQQQPPNTALQMTSPTRKHSMVPMDNTSPSSLQKRRQALAQIITSSFFLATAITLSPQKVNAAQDEEEGVQQQQQKPQLYTKKTDKFSYQFQPPPNFDSGNNKPLKTHLDEINFKSNNGYQFGITVDPVRIQSLEQFGTPEQVAAKVVLAEVNRDGVFDVTLMKDPYSSSSSSSSSYYQLNYLSKGKRGDKRFVTKFYIQNQFLFALTAQCKEADYADLESEMMQAVDSFQIL